MAEGWIKIYRNIQDNWIWNCEPFSRGQAWVDLLLMANHKETKVMINGNLIVVAKGERVTSIRKLSEKWKWSTCKTNHFLKQLENDKMIEYKSDTSKTVIKIVNYEQYQENNAPLSFDNTSFSEEVKNTEKTAKIHRANTEQTQKNTNKNDKEYIKNDKEEEERKEIQHNSLPPLSFSSSIHKDIFNLIGKEGYRMWFEHAEITEHNDKIIIKAEKV